MTIAGAKVKTVVSMAAFIIPPFSRGWIVCLAWWGLPVSAPNCSALTHGERRRAAETVVDRFGTIRDHPRSSVKCGTPSDTAPAGSQGPRTRCTTTPAAHIQEDVD